MVIRCSIRHHAQCSVVDCIELARLVRVANVGKKVLDKSTCSWLSHLCFIDSDFSHRCWEQEIDCLRLISIVLVVSNGLLLLPWDVSPHSGASKSSIIVLISSDNISGANLGAPAEVFVRLELHLGGFAMDAFGSVPLSRHVSIFAIDVMFGQRVEPLT